MMRKRSLFNYWGGPDRRQEEENREDAYNYRFAARPDGEPWAYGADHGPDHSAMTNPYAAPSGAYPAAAWLPDARDEEEHKDFAPQAAPPLSGNPAAMEYDYQSPREQRYTDPAFKSRDDAQEAYGYRFAARPGRGAWAYGLDYGPEQSGASNPYAGPSGAYPAAAWLPDVQDEEGHNDFAPEAAPPLSGNPAAEEYDYESPDDGPKALKEQTADSPPAVEAPPLDLPAFSGPDERESRALAEERANTALGMEVAEFLAGLPEQNRRDGQKRTYRMDGLSNWDLRRDHPLSESLKPILLYDTDYLEHGFFDGQFTPGGMAGKINRLYKWLNGKERHYNENKEELRSQVAAEAARHGRDPEEALRDYSAPYKAAREAQRFESDVLPARVAESLAQVLIDGQIDGPAPGKVATAFDLGLFSDRQLAGMAFDARERALLEPLRGKDKYALRQYAWDNWEWFKQMARDGQSMTAKALRHQMTGPAARAGEELAGPAGRAAKEMSSDEEARRPAEAGEPAAPPPLTLPPVEELARSFDEVLSVEEVEGFSERLRSFDPSRDKPADLLAVVPEACTQSFTAMVSEPSLGEIFGLPTGQSRRDRNGAQSLADQTLGAILGVPRGVLRADRKAAEFMSDWLGENWEQEFREHPFVRFDEHPAGRAGAMEGPVSLDRLFGVTPGFNPEDVLLAEKALFQIGGTLLFLAGGPMGIAGKLALRGMTGAAVLGETLSASALELALPLLVQTGARVKTMAILYGLSRLLDRIKEGSGKKFRENIYDATNKAEAAKKALGNKLAGGR